VKQHRLWFPSEKPPWFGAIALWVCFSGGWS